MVVFIRFLLRVRCGPVPDASLGAVLEAGWRLESAVQPTPVLNADQVREIQRAARLVSLAPAREAFIDLIIKLRQAGILISDRRAVRLQRAVAGSALLAGRTEARVSDLWVLAHIWDREEQMEIIASLVRSTLQQAGASEGDHPRAHGDESPDPEALAAAMEALAARIAAGPNAAAADELRLLTSRMEWVKNAHARDALREKAAALWHSLSP